MLRKAANKRDFVRPSPVAMSLDRCLRLRDPRPALTGLVLLSFVGAERGTKCCLPFYQCMGCLTTYIQAPLEIVIPSYEGTQDWFPSIELRGHGLHPQGTMIITAFWLRA